MEKVRFALNAYLWKYVYYCLIFEPITSDRIFWVVTLLSPAVLTFQLKG